VIGKKHERMFPSGGDGDHWIHVCWDVALSGVVVAPAPNTAVVPKRDVVVVSRDRNYTIKGRRNIAHTVRILTPATNLAG
jgi:hypothetical protein